MDGWGEFGKIVEYDATSVENISTSSDVKEVFRYSANGQRLSAPAKGLNIVKYSDGSVKKVAVQQYYEIAANDKADTAFNFDNLFK